MLICDTNPSAKYGRGVMVDYPNMLRVLHVQGYLCQAARDIAQSRWPAARQPFGQHCQTDRETGQSRLASRA